MGTHSKRQFNTDDHIRFWRAVDFMGPVPDPEKYPNVIGRCWGWRLAKDRKGYGIFTKSLLREEGVGVNIIASRAAFIFQRGDIRPESLCVLHHCDNPGCVRPLHCFLGTRKDNMNDCLSKQRYPTGELHYCSRMPERIMRGEGRWNCKLTADKARQILQLRTEGLKWREIGEKMGLPESSIAGVLTGKNWSHATGLHNSRRK